MKCLRDYMYYRGERLTPISRNPLSYDIKDTPVLNTIKHKKPEIPPIIHTEKKLFGESNTETTGRLRVA